ncbi:unnamed protein product [Notodromas monacha]|uniref:Uncharacterized protein n=1 Tax=Notodromas monacha TaxID=399045 RepID=A0A7R9BVV0_9CRUS|nr:unnamed protein product [Notodromas monacha]CAG0922334.1 unnamed protein product [Notodromas monacha]
MHVILSNWAPPLERSRMVTMVYAGSCMGTILTLAQGGVMMRAWGWVSIFYFYGGLTVIWFVAWFFLVSDSPENHPYISKEEKLFILATLSKEKKTISTMPWKQILTSVPFWALLVTHMGNNLGYWMLLTQLTTYMNNILHFEIQEVSKARQNIPEGYCNEVTPLFESWYLWRHVFRRSRDLSMLHTLGHVDNNCTRVRRGTRPVCRNTDYRVGERGKEEEGRKSVAWAPKPTEEFVQRFRVDLCCVVVCLSEQLFVLSKSLESEVCCENGLRSPQKNSCSDSEWTSVVLLSVCLSNYLSCLKALNLKCVVRLY